MKFYYRPIFIGWIHLVLSLPLALLFGTGAAIGMRLFVPERGNKEAAQAGLGVFAALLLVQFIIRRINHAHTEYRFYEDRIEYRQNFLTYTTKTVKYRDIAKLQMHQDLLMKPLHMGSVFITTRKARNDNAPDVRSLLGVRSFTSDGLIIRDIENPKAACQRIAEISGFLKG